MGRCRSQVRTTPTSGPATFRTTSCPASSILRPAFWRRPMAASRPTIIPTSSAWSGCLLIARNGFTELLSEPKKFVPADMLAIQTDVVSPFDRFCAERFVYSIDHTPKASKRAKEAAELMRNWDGTMDVDSVAATIAVSSTDKLKEMLLKAKLGRGLDVVSLVSGAGVAGRRIDASAGAMAPAGLLQLRSASDRGRRGRCLRSQYFRMFLRCGSGDACIASTSSTPSGATSLS